MEVDVVTIEKVEDTKVMEDEVVVESDAREVEEDMRVEDSEVQEVAVEIATDLAHEQNSLLFNIPGNL